MLRAKFHISSKRNSMLNIITSCLAMCSFQLVLVIDLFNHNNQFSLSFLSWFSYRQTPAVSDHFPVHQEWSLTRQLIIRAYGKAGIRNRKRSRKRKRNRNRSRNPSLRNKNWRRFRLESVTNNNCAIKIFHPRIVFIYCYYIFLLSHFLRTAQNFSSRISYTRERCKLGS